MSKDERRNKRTRRMKETFSKLSTAAEMSPNKYTPLCKILGRFLKKDQDGTLAKAPEDKEIDDNAQVFVRICHFFYKVLCYMCKHEYLFQLEGTDSTALFVC